MDLLNSLVAQTISGFTNAMFLFIMASGLSLIFGVMRILNFAHGSLYMFGAYLSYQLTSWLGGGSNTTFFLAALGAATLVAILGVLIERLFFTRLYDKPELNQLLFTYAIVLGGGDLVKWIWGTEQLAVRRPQALAGSLSLLGTTVPVYSLFISATGLVLAVGIWSLLTYTGIGRIIRAAALDREMLQLLGVDVRRVFTLVFASGAFLAGLAGALIAPVTAIVPGMDAEVTIALFIIVVIGGLGSFWGTFAGSIIYGIVLAYGILVMPRFSLFAVALMMAVVLIVRPSGLFGREVARS